MLETNPTLEDVLSHADVYGSATADVVKISGQNVRLSKMQLSDDDWPTIDMYLNRKKGCVNLVFVLMVFHFPKRFDYENLGIFMDSGGKRVREMARRISIRLDEEAGALEDGGFIEELKSGIENGCVPAA